MIWTLGLVSLLMDTSSELIHSLLPLFLVTSLGASALALGAIEGIAEATALCTKVFSGYLSDYFRRRKLLTGLGYALAALSKPLFALATSFAWVFAARLIDRLGKGIREAPRDALIADVTPPAVQGAAYGLRQALDTVGAVAGPSLAIAAMLWLNGNFRSTFWLASVPAFAAVVLLVVGVREPVTAPAKEPSRRVALSDVSQLSTAYWWVVGFGAVMMLARSSEAFLLLRARSVGMTLAWIPLVMVLMSAVYALVAYPAGVLADRGRHRSLLQGGLLALLLADVVLASAASVTAVCIGTALWGVHMGLTQGVLAARVAATAQETLRATAFGIFNLVSGAALLVASLLAGWLWDAFGPAQTFFAGAAFTLLAICALAADPSE